ncbi:MAG: efflux RND transporter permease subunit [Chromatiaceae bacterium]
MISGTRTSIAVKVFGDDLYELRRIAKVIESRMAEIPGVVDLMVEQQADIPFVTIAMRRKAITRHGLRVRDVVTTIETAFYGRVLSKVLEGQTSFDLVLRYGDEAREDIQRVRETLVTTPSGARLPLHAIACPGGRAPRSGAQYRQPRECPAQDRGVRQRGGAGSA